MPLGHRRRPVPTYLKANQKTWISMVSSRSVFAQAQDAVLPGLGLIKLERFVRTFGLRTIRRVRLDSRAQACRR